MNDSRIYVDEIIDNVWKLHSVENIHVVLT